MPLEDLLRHDDTRMRRAAAKLTHVGEQTIPVSTIVIQVYYYLPSLNVFSSLHTSGISYSNDELPIILNFSVSPQEFRCILEEANRVWNSIQEMGGQPSLSFAVVVDTPDQLEGQEILLTYNSGVALHHALSAALDRTNGVGHTVLKIQRASAYPTEVDTSNERT